MEINKKWETISSAILKAAMKYIPWITVKKTEAQVKTSVPKCKMYKEIKFLFQLQKKRHKHDREEINPDDQARFNRQIENINQLYQMQILLMPDSWSQIETEELKN